MYAKIVFNKNSLHKNFLIGLSILVRKIHKKSDDKFCIFNKLLNLNKLKQKKQCEIFEKKNSA